jgi:GT2 family glycosyltransferase
VIVVSYEARQDLRACLASLGAGALPLEIVVVDNASTDGSAAMVRAEFPEARLLEPGRNVGFACASNLGLRATRAPYVLFLNPDAELGRGSVEALVRILDGRPDVAALGPRTRHRDGTIQVSFGAALTPLGEWRQRRLVAGVRARRRESLARAEAMAARECEPGWLSASCLLARREALDAVGGFDEGFFLYEEDVDLCVRLRRAGWRLLFTPATEVVHGLGRSMERAPGRSRLEYHRSHLRYYGKHNGALATTLLRAWVAAGAALAWLRRLGPGAERAAARKWAAATFRVAFSPA